MWLRCLLNDDLLPLQISQKCRVVDSCCPSFLLVVFLLLYIPAEIKHCGNMPVYFGEPASLGVGCSM